MKVLHSSFEVILPGKVYEQEYSEFCVCFGEPMIRRLVDLKYANIW